MTKIAAVQMCSSNVVDDNLKDAATLIAEAANKGAQLIVLPENFSLMGDKTEDKILHKEVFGNGKIQSFLSDQAKKFGIWIVGGTIPLACDDEKKVRAACLTFDDQGNFVCRYDKIHLFDVVLSKAETYQESAITEPGHEIVVSDSPFGKLGFAVCYDIRFPELFRCLFNRGTEIIVLPAAFTVETGKAHWELLARSRAVENFCYFIGACQGGSHANGRTTHGNSLIVDPWGSIVAKKEGVETGVILAEIDLANVQRARKAIPIKDHQRIFFDTSRL